ncbi:mechanosensitive ion channel family protein [Luteimonas granuli]|uniref:Small-conductance mechanosensitive channel n=1 Tax=Luteimonas granuli TaxID=1176533 RepID=A0A518N6S2_9GAMM|nr:mechanosensitive ion channel family protein [Luteimonas granuli]QDW67624.1 mechanosensitive ion channel [Luteimonas granuli]
MRPYLRHVRPALLILLLALASAAGVHVLARDAGAGPAPEASTDADLAGSRDLARRLRETDGLRDVTVTVRDGVAELEGVVLDAGDRERAEQVASQQPGISRVENRVILSTRLSERLALATTLAMDKLTRLIAALPLLLVALLVVALAWWAGRWLGRRAGQRIARRNWQSENPYFASLMQQLVQWLALLGGVLVALDLLGATALVGAVMGSAGVIGLALGFAFKDIAENYVAGVLLSIRRPFAPGELLRIDNTHEGRVAALTPRATVLVTHDGNRLTLPNALVFKSVVLNFSSNARRRLEFAVPVDVSESIRCVHELAMEAIRGTDGVLADPGPSWTVDGYDATAITLRFFAWVDQRESDLGKVRSEAIHAVRTRLQQAGISPPRNIQFTASLPAAEVAAPPVAGMTQAPADGTSRGDTSVNRDLDAHLAAEQRAHAGEDLLPGEAGPGRDR